MGRCSICGRELNVPEGDVTSRDCGGDCLMCMAEAGDLDCFTALTVVLTQLTKIQLNRLALEDTDGRG
jgi:hypothetical protein